MDDLLRIVLDDGRCIIDRGYIYDWGVEISPAKGVFQSYPWHRIRECLQVKHEVTETSEFNGDPMIRKRSADEMYSLAEIYSDPLHELIGESK